MIKIKDIIIGLILAIFVYFVFTLSDNHFPTTDSLPNNFTTVNLVYNHRPDLTNIIEEIKKHDLMGIVVKNENGQIFSKTPILNGYLAVPYFYIADQLNGIKEFRADLLFDNGVYYQIVGKHYASFLSAISVFILYVTLLIYFKKTSIALTATCTYGLASFVLSTASQANWEHAPSLLLISLAYFLLIKYFNNKKTIYIVLVTILIATSYLIRPVNVIFIVSLLLILIISKKKKDILFSLGWVAVIVIVYRYFCNAIGIPNGYSNEIVSSLKEINVLNSIKVFISILISPNSGLFTYYPVFFFSFIGLFMFLKKTIKHKKIESKKLILLFSTLNILFIFGLNSIWWAWTGGTSWGPRLLTEATIPLIFFISYFLAYSKLNKQLTYLIMIPLFALSMFNCFVCIYCNTTEWNDKYWSRRSMMEGAWELKPTMINYYVFNKRSFFIEKLKVNNHDISFSSKTILFYAPEKEFKIIYSRTNKLIPNQAN